MDTQYERKLELVRAIREENRANVARMNHRESILYGYTSKPGQAGYQTYGTKTEENTEQEAVVPNYNKGQSFWLRSLIAAIFVLAFLGIKTGKIDTILGISDTQIESVVKEDFSNMVVDYMKDFTYTLDYEKTSIK